MNEKNIGFKACVEGIPEENMVVEALLSSGNIYESKFIDGGFTFDILSHEDSFVNIIAWRKIKELKPDFSKLIKGDILIIEHFCEYDKTNNVCVFIFSDIDEENIGGYKDSGWMNKNEYLDRGWIIKKTIKKITRVDIKNREFEDIW